MKISRTHRRRKVTINYIARYSLHIIYVDNISVFSRTANITNEKKKEKKN